MEEIPKKEPAPRPEAEKNNPENEQYLFYNVMPKSKTDQAIVQPKLTVVQNQNPTPEPATGPGFLKKHLKLLIIVIALIILAAGGYFGYMQFINNAYKPQNLLGSNLKSSSPSTGGQGTQHPTATSTSSQIPSDWQVKYFGSALCNDPATCGDSADPDRDGLANSDEFKLNTDPNNPDSDGDGLADGDEAKIFLTSPITNHSGIDKKYTDSDNIIGGYNPDTNKKFSAQDLQEILKRIKDLGLHEPTLKTLGDSLTKIYHFDGTPIATTTPVSLQTASSSPDQSTSSPATSGVDQSAKAKQDRDAQRSNTIQNIGIALLKYKAANTTFPSQTSFADMYAEVKSYNLIATNPLDPINKDPYIYGYEPASDGSDFTMSFYSETQNQIIKVHAADAQKYVTDQQAAANDDQRKTDLDSIQSALLLYSNENAAGNQDYVFPTQAKLKTDLVPKYLSALPKDPVSGSDYDYQVSATFNTFTLKAVLQAPAAGTTGYMCNQDDCSFY